MPDNIFEDEWRECLRAHYMSVIREDDQKTLRTLKGVLREVGFGDDELNELQVLARLRVEDMPDDFVPDLDILQPDDSAVDEPQVYVAGMTPASPAADEASLTPTPELFEGDDELIEDTPLDEEDEDDTPPLPPTDAPTQLSLF